MFANNFSLYLSIFPLAWFYRQLFAGLFMLAGSQGGGSPSSSVGWGDDAMLEEAVYGV
jgi:hypothetical protein